MTSSDYNHIMRARVYFQRPLNMLLPLWEKLAACSLVPATPPDAPIAEVAVGYLTKHHDLNGRERYSFQYDPHYCDVVNWPIASSLMVRREPYVSNALPPFFDNLIVEGWLAEHAEKSFHIHKDNRFALLMVTGQHCFGAVRVQALDTQGDPLAPPTSPTRPTAIYDDQLKLQKNKSLRVQLDTQEPSLSFRHTIYGASISGAQKKGLFRWDKKLRAFIPTSKQAEYILKPEGQFDELPANEHFSMLIAQKLGFDMPDFTLIKLKNLGFVFVVRRFDRIDGQALMMEDMAQVLHRLSHNKYSLSCEKVAKAIIKHTAAPQVNLYNFYRRLVFNYFIANADMHLKNWALVENSRQMQSYKLAPCYDILNTRLAISNEPDDMSLSLGGKQKNLRAKDFRLFAKQLNIPQADRVFEQLPHWWQSIQTHIPQSFLSPSKQEHYLNIVEQRYKILTR